MQIIIETFKASGEPSRARIRARPIPGQGLSTDLRVECSKSMRALHPVGTLFKVNAHMTDRLGGAPFLKAYHGEQYEVVSLQEAQGFVASSQMRR